MSLYPCRADGKRIVGPASTIYASLFAGSFMAKKKLHYCQSHAHGAVVAATQGLVLVLIGDTPQIDLDELGELCDTCGDYAAYTLRVDSYVKGDETRAWRAKLCDKHVDQAASRVDLSL